MRRNQWCTAACSLVALLQSLAIDTPEAIHSRRRDPTARAVVPSALRRKPSRPTSATPVKRPLTRSRSSLPLIVRQPLTAAVQRLCPFAVSSPTRPRRRRTDTAARLGSPQRAHFPLVPGPVPDLRIRRQYADTWDRG
ncbi:hypothetical protein HBI56_203620 [Parastagonospora nodorum]|uniref:Secreted protein n=2 Tax=Phaeosphaeria nodorum (strain SN15 / ATCC MYA-4574 / FGSC 10173) TaxID=321614 RepID=A0A7U2FAF5_PHANO|nr:hypothetical protein SNOG_12214 [Parastagonospora nodorum SN15]KAH3910488.1 hypothetical protein HBH56_142440 [Parastagonospora nodorum]EAT80626.1 hypothetical protein SNOG_12214 [Parastagonospora nodorum SN15]KAH3927764.1 hypothetical protein HBH54_147630 [Parastagonospora nodorum]KAH3962045.1 hypothetical protein HBH51_179320 [Parastagonospora nodorum]KAH3997665.1 hypothetical protein HBI10_138560 [Parastagonospora nodorum]